MRRGLSVRRSRGFGLIEVLVTLLIFSIGALAVAGLQVMSKKNRYNALQRSTAVRLAHSMAANMQANSDALSVYISFPDWPLGDNTLGADPKHNCYQESCSPKKLAKFDLWQWEQMLDGTSEMSNNTATATAEGGLVAPSACIYGPSDGDSGVYTITIAWRGVTPVNQSTSIDCGSARPANWYSAPGSGSANTYQRHFTLKTYIPE